MLALLAQAHGLDDKAHRSAKRTLLRMDENTLRWWGGYDEKLPDKMKPILNIFATKVPALWLAAYWMGRLQGVW